jgi:hypothetical protein
VFDGSSGGWHPPDIALPATACLALRFCVRSRKGPDLQDCHPIRLQLNTHRDCDQPALAVALNLVVIIFEESYVSSFDERSAELISAA